MEWGDKIDLLLNRARKGKPTPALDAMPELYEDLRCYWNAFIELDETRTVGFAANPISYLEIEAWLRLHSIDDSDERIGYTETIRFLDTHCLRIAKDKSTDGK
jgi:hypothetical protein